MTKNISESAGQPTKASFNASSIAVLASTQSAVNAGLSISEGCASARAILRHQMHRAPNDTTRGLPTLYKGLHGRGNIQGVKLKEVKSVLTDSFNDFLDAVSLVTSLDSGIDS